MDTRRLVHMFFPNEKSSFKIDAIISEIERIVETLDEREQCVLEKKLDGETYKRIGKAVVKIFNGNPCDGISTERSRQILIHALRKIQYRLKFKLGINTEISAYDISWRGKSERKKDITNDTKTG